MNRPSSQPRSQAILEEEIQRLEDQILMMVGRARLEVIKGIVFEEVHDASELTLEMGISKAIYQLPIKLKSLDLVLNESMTEAVNDLIQFSYQFFALKNANDSTPCRSLLEANKVRGLIFDGRIFCPLSALPHTPPCPVGHRGTFFTLPTPEGEGRFAQCCDTRLQDQPQRLVRISKGH